ncbi:Exopolysaccharide biosynthesis protein YbjH [Cognatiyoonia koreensis]|uniref:Exopolysaccharide biosynthesis protein YbjH n=1 Tax=Cognatiyoonia koreensis TaxID=364200 RepID=A0A1I0RRY3_9RHOB|nr:YjbH domain-containing protein [Cognatiyoonia koreensis]SEW44069.1 Exopolysaccharide biosynthesis protein YbjH [Cognatiyoonia koreensis]
MRSVVCSLFLGLGVALPAMGQQLTTYGTPGLVDLPTAQTLDDGEIALTYSQFGANTRQTLTFQVLPRVYGSFRYIIIEGYGGLRQPDRFDRNFDIHFQAFDETDYLPAIGIGLRDFGGTGIYQSEYVVATKTLTPQLQVTGGLGWGRLAGRNAMGSPFGFIDKRFETRPRADEGGIETTGQLDASNWFRGDVSPFFGVSYQATDSFRVVAEYSPDLYTSETQRNTISVESPWNVGLNYQFDSGLNLTAFAIGGTEVGAQLSYVINPAERPVPGSRDPAPLPILPRSSVAAASWNVSGQPDAVEAQLAQNLRSEGFVLQGVSLRGDQATIRVQNQRWDASAQAAGRATRVMANTLAPSYENFAVVFQQNGVPVTRVRTARSDIEDLQYHYDGAWRTFARAAIDDPIGIGRSGELDAAFPVFSYSISPFFSFSFFDPDAPLRAETGPQLDLTYRPSPGLSFYGSFRYPVAGNIDDATRRSNSKIQRVRSDAVLYAIESDFEVNVLTTEYMYRPAQDMFARVTAGYLENMYGGVSGELLWYPNGSRLALGAELNYARQRDFDMLFGFQDYDVVTGHASAYYDLGNGFVTQLDVGRYLAGDWGATVSVDREFNNGFKVGAYFTLTDVPFDEFGEGSFDKGIRVEMPVSWLLGQASQSSISQTIQPVLRDGGARLSVNNRLYGVVQDYRGTSIADSWGRYLR